MNERLTEDGRQSDAESDPILDFKLVNLVKVELFDSNAVETKP